MKEERNYKINQYDMNGNYIKTWENGNKIKETLGFNKTNIQKACNLFVDKRGVTSRSAYNYQWRYLKDCNENNNIENYNRKIPQTNHNRKYKYRGVNLINKNFDKLKVISQYKRADNGHGMIWKCQCKCGNIVYKSTSSLKENQYNSCNECKSWVEGRLKNNKNKYFKTIEKSKPNLIKYFVNKEYLSYSASSCKEIKAYCDCCGKIYDTTIRSLCLRKQKTCCDCSDNYSFAEKILYNILKELNITFEREKSFEWSDNKRYDFYINNLSCIIELNGRQHYEDVEYFSKCNFEDNVKNDLYKKELAISNNIKKYIIIKTDISNFDYIYNNILNSDLNKIINFELLNKTKIELNSQKSIFSKIVNLYNDGNNCEKISSLIGFNVQYIWLNLRKAKKLKLLTREYPKRKNNIKIICDNKIYDSLSSFVLNNGLNIGHTSEWLSGSRPIPQKWKDKGLRYYNEETDRDLPIWNEKGDINE